jgi:hypothetical protein
MDPDHWLMPLTSDMQQQRRAHKLLGDLLGRTERRMYDETPLPPMRWAISSTGILVGDPLMPDPEAARKAYEAWAAELRIRKRHEHTRDGVTYLRAPGTVDGVQVTIEAEIHESSED